MRIYIIRIFVLLGFLVALQNADAASRKKQPADTIGLGCRGVMESFPKIAEGIDERLDFYVGEGLTHYFYSPSDDRYCNRWGWKFLYNDSDRHAVRRLNALCQEKGLEFVWTLTPGSNYGWTQADYKFLFDKLVMMYYNGLRSFAVDFSGNEGNRHAVRDSLVKDFVMTRPEKVSLYMIDDMPMVEYPSSGATAVETLMRGYHFDDAFLSKAEETDAMLCNLYSCDEFAKLAVVATADCSRNPSEYSPDDSMADAIRILDDDIRDAFMTFLSHTGAVDESKEVSTFELDDWTAEKAAALFQEFDRIEKVPDVFREESDSEIIDALRPWFVEFGRLGTRGKRVLKCMEYYKSGNIGEFWLAYISSQVTPKEMEEYAAHPVGENKLHPFCIRSMEQMKEGFASMLTGDTALHNLASTLYDDAGAASDSDFATSVSTGGYMEFAIPASANTCHLLTGELKDGERVIFRQLGTDGRLIAEFVVKSPFTAFDIKDGAVKVDVLGNVDIYETIFVYL